MRRREFITLFGAAATAWPLAARAQQQPVHPLIGVLSPLSAALAARNLAGFRSGLRDLGYLEGRDVTLALRYGDGAPERMAPLAQELVALKPDVLMIGGARSGALAAQAATRTIPSVIITTDDPVASGVAHSITRPGGNITGTWFDYDAVVSKRLEFLKLAVPALGRVGVIVYPSDAIDALTIPRLSAATRALGITLEQFEVRDLTKLEAVAAVIGARECRRVVRRRWADSQLRPRCDCDDGGAPAITGYVWLPRVRGRRQFYVLWVQSS
ncbi:MAG: ABC transporter substrate-binding protein [Xanthobacteraceae bacterium]